MSIGGTGDSQEHNYPPFKMDKIPTEILIHIFLFCSQRNVRKSLCCVGHFWRTAINASPFFWTEVGLHRTTDELLEILLRNPNGPLDISWAPSNPSKFMDIAAMERMAKISPQSHRWRSLVLAGQMTDQIQSQLIEVPAPRLINFSVVGSFVPTIRFSIPEAGEPLSELILVCTALDWENPRVRGLRCLRLHNLGAKAPTVEQLHAILSTSPGLEILDLAFWTDESQNQPRLEKLGVILLPSLTTLAVAESSLFLQRANQFGRWMVELGKDYGVHYALASRSNVLKALNGLISQRGSGIYGEVAALQRIFLQNGLEPPLKIWDSEQGWNDETMANDQKNPLSISERILD
ncbi:hypothetical protein M407DRAFT_7183 [Tulasnella calospora MUT 4182]|uniref:F-box domain-containing protein n=1 Tax=Tulasnella calospora MUT 4182 TaxID=1051891 RepID=A0A0C3QK65_9AGAM|nr:hypothetical protein M407DRAFT_7183 [Tulasnella calospora MUT 4182]